MKVTLTARNVDTVRQKLRRHPIRTVQAVRKVNLEFRDRLLLLLVHHASGRPGPEIESGAFVGNFRARTINLGMSIEAWNDSPQTARLEFGFMDIDSLGRHYTQPPYPVFRPTLQEIAPEYIRAIREAVSRP